MDRAAGLLAAIKAVHAAGLDPDLWPQALARIMDLTGSRAAVLEVYDRPSLHQRAIHSWNMRQATRAEYLAWGGPPNSRTEYGLQLGAGEVFYDSCMFDEAGIDRDPFYAEFLVHHEVRYFMSGVVERGHGTQTMMTLARTPRQGHVGAEEIALMPILMPHVRLALEVGDRLAAAAGRASAFGETLDWLGDGAAVLASDGRVLHANAALSSMAQADDGVRLRSGRVSLAGPAADALARAVGSAARLSQAETMAAPTSFMVPRPSGAAAYVASLRPLFRREWEGGDAAVAVLFLRDPERAVTAPPPPGLTPAEAALASALRAGVSPVDHARERGVSVNTVYTHLRRLKEKTGARRIPDLLRRLHESGGGTP
ncbi:MAG: helix-turn-helix transcriptional regulator [Pseudomonadota bacterium]